MQPDLYKLCRVRATSAIVRVAIYKAFWITPPCIYITSNNTFFVDILALFHSRLENVFVPIWVQSGEHDRTVLVSLWESHRSSERNKLCFQIVHFNRLAWCSILWCIYSMACIIITVDCSKLATENCQTAKPQSDNCRAGSEANNHASYLILAHYYVK